MTSTTRPYRKFATTIVLSGALALSAGAALAAGTYSNGDAAAGKKLFLKDCAACHKQDASGGIKLGDTESADLQSPGLEKMYHEDDALIARAILTGVDEEGETLDKVMPRWGKRGLKDSQVADLIAYLHTVKTVK